MILQEPAATFPIEKHEF